MMGNMNTKLRSVVERVAALPDADQVRYAEWLQAEIDDDQRWDEQFARGSSMLKQMAEAALEEDDRGMTRPWPVDEDQ